MELKIRHRGKNLISSLIRYTAIILLPVLLLFYIMHFAAFNRFLIHLNPSGIIPLPVWILCTKFFSYCLQILINFCILLAVTSRLRYSFTLVLVSFIMLMTGALIVWIRDHTGIPVSLTLVAFFVKLNKSFILLVLFLAGHFVRFKQAHP